MTYYADLREYLDELERRDLLIRVSERVNKDTEIHPLVRLQFRGLESERRRGWLFENVTDSRGRHYPSPLSVACLASSKAMYATGLMCDVDEIPGRWEVALARPLDPVLVPSGACQEVVHVGESLLEHGGLDEFPVPISTPGFDNAPYLTAAHVVSRHPVSGVRNLGNYRCMLKSPDRLGCFSYQHLLDHWTAARKLGLPALEVAIAIGTTPNLSYVAAGRVPADVEEYGVAGALVGSAVELVQCRTVDLQVPAHAEVVIEGVIPTDALELEGPFGEYTGYMASRGPMMFLEVSAITHRVDPIFSSFVSQYPPSESSLLRATSREPAFRKLLSQDLNLPGVVDVAYLEEVGSFPLVVIQLDRRIVPSAADVVRAIAGTGRHVGKVTVIVDDDINPRDFGQIWHAIGWRAQAPRDFFTVPMILNSLDPSAAPPDSDRGERVFHHATGGALIIDATKKWDYPPLSLPPRPIMERALELWSSLGLEPLELREPWHGEDGWDDLELAEEAKLALRGDHQVTGTKFAALRSEPASEPG